MTTDFQQYALENLKRFLAPLISAVGNEENMRALLARVGWDAGLLPDDVLSGLQDVLASVETGAVTLSTEPASLDEVLDALEAAHHLVRSIEQFTRLLGDLSLRPAPDPKELLSDLLSYLAIEYLYTENPKLLFALFLLGVVTPPRSVEQPLVDENDYIVRLPPNPPRIELSMLINLLRDPTGSLSELYLPIGGLADASAAKEFSDRIFPRIAFLLSSLGFQNHYNVAGMESDRTLYLRCNTIPGNRLEVDCLVVPTSEGGPALDVKANGIVDLEHVIEGWLFELEAEGELPSFRIGPAGVTLLNNGEGGEVHIRVSAARLGTSDEPVLLLGSREETRLEVGLFLVEAHFDSQGPNYGLGFHAGGCAFVLDASSADGFLKKVLPPDGVRANFNIGLSWSYLDGFKLCGDLGLEVDLPLSLSIYDIVKLESLHLALRGESNELSVAGGLSTVLNLGPVIASVQRVGLKATYGFEDASEKGFHFGLLSPTGVGLAIDASGITGGGILDFDDPNKRYTGSFGLNFAEIGLAAVGLIETKLPDGSEGFALIVSIGAIFQPPIRLPLGFSLSAVGGLIGVNRSVEVNALRAGLKNRTLDAILFPDPDTVVANASQLISGLRSVFPPQESRYVVGPMVRVTWGSPTIIKADMGIFLEFPDPLRLLLLGTLDAALPKEDKALIVIHLDVLGIIDFAKAELTFQASLYDSRILSYTLFGDSAFLLGWGHDPRFALSLGGFHPKFTPPPPAIVFADLKRLTLNLGTGKKLQLTCCAYQALTPNSLQFGARVDLFASGGGFSLHGYLGFDALFYISPFSFEVEIRGGVSLKYRSLSLFSVTLHFRLSGPTPWSARGKATISLFFFSISVRFSVTWGRREPVSLPPVNAWELLQPALVTAESWSSVLPAGRGQVESLRGIEEGVPEQVLIHPAGGFEVRQNVVPLGVTVKTIGNAPVATYDLFDIPVMTVGSKTVEPVPVEEFFARGQFEDLTSDQRLSVPSFEKMKGGVTMPGQRACIEGAMEDKAVEYESILINPDRTSQKQDLSGALEWEDARFATAASATRQASRRAGPNTRFAARRAQPKVGVAEEGYCIATVADLRRVRLSPELNEENRNMTRMRAEQVLKAQTELTPEQERQLAVVPEHEAYEAFV